LFLQKQKLAQRYIPIGYPGMHPTGAPAADKPAHSLTVDQPRYSMKRLGLLPRMLESKEEEEEEERIFKVSCKPHAQILTVEHIHRDAHVHTDTDTDTQTANTSTQ
jgi:hypothetical protein